MKPASFRKLTWEIVNKFVGRKRPNAIALICDTNTQEVYVVPHEIEHVDFAGLLLGVTQNEIRANPSIASHLVPVTIELNNMHDEVMGMQTGTSGMELGFRVRHSRQQLTTAQAMAQAFIFTGEVPVSEKKFAMYIAR